MTKTEEIEESPFLIYINAKMKFLSPQDYGQSFSIEIELKGQNRSLFISEDNLYIRRPGSSIAERVHDKDEKGREFFNELRQDPGFGRIIIHEYGRAARKSFNSFDQFIDEIRN